MTIRLGLHIPTFTYGTPVSELFPTVIRQAQEAEEGGFDAVSVMNHFYQLPALGSPDQPMLEAYTALGALATATKTVQLGTLVTGNTYRNPALVAKAVTTLDVVSGGRAFLGIGTGWFQLEHDQLGFEFGTFTDRFNRLEEALQIILPMIKGERAMFSGDWYHTDEAFANPRFRDHIPLLIGGRGEKKTFRLAARHFEEVGRDPATLETSMPVGALIGEKMSADQIPPDMKQNMVVGSAESVADQIKSKVLDAGIDGVIIMAPLYSPGSVADVGKALKPLVS